MLAFHMIEINISKVHKLENSRLNSKKKFNIVGAKKCIRFINMQLFARNPYFPLSINQIA